jgi:hypothetical protein
MCFSPLASLTTFIIGIIGAILCLTLGTPSDSLIGLFFGFISLMQGIEYILWKNQQCDIINKSATILGIILNHLQPIILGILVLLLNNNLSKTKRHIIILLMIIYTIVITTYTIQFINDDDKCTLKNEHDHLQWDWNYMKYRGITYIVFLFMLIFLFYIGTPDRNAGMIIALVLFISYIFSYFIYINKKVVGSLWCLFSSFIPILWFIYKKLL